MNQRRFALSPDGPTRIELTWEGGVKNVRVFFDGVLVHSFADAKAIRAGATFPLPDGTHLTVRLMGIGGFDVRRDGVPVPGSDSDPSHALRAAARLILIVAGMSVAIHLEGFVRSDSASVARPITIALLAYDAMLLVLGLLTRRGARWALGAALALTALRALGTWPLTESVFGTLYWVAVTLLLWMRFSGTAKR